MKLLIVSLLFPSLLYGQVTFNKVFNIEQGVEAASGVVEHDDGYIFYGTGSEYSEFNGWRAMVLLKTDFNGNVLWHKKFGKSGEAQLTESGALKKLSSGNLFVAGAVYDSITEQFDALMLKFSPSGDTIWRKKFGTLQQDEYFLGSLEYDNNNIFAIGAKIISQTNWDYFIVKTDSNGNQIWQRTYGGNRIDEGWAMDITHDGNLIVAGGREFPPDVWDGHLMKMMPNGTPIWHQRYGTENGDCAIIRINTTIDGGFIFTSCLDTVINVGDEQLVRYIAKIDSSGNLLWRNFYNAPSGREKAINMVRGLNDGSILFCGSAWNNEISRFSGWLMKLDTDGNELWENKYHYFNNNESPGPISTLYDFQQTSDGGIVCAGSAFGVFNHSDFWLLKLDEYGCEIPGCHVGIKEKENTGKVFVYPNPAKEKIFVSIKSSNQQHAFKEAVLKIYDVAGKEIYTQTSTLNTSAYSEYFVNTSAFEIGIYFYKVTTGNQILGTGKIMVQ